MLTTQDRLRNQLLRDGLGDALAVDQVVSLISHDHLAETAPDQQELALQTIRSLLVDGLVDIGDSTDEAGRLVHWELPADTAVARVRDRFVEHDDQPPARTSGIRLSLTASGRDLAEAMCREP